MKSGIRTPAVAALIVAVAAGTTWGAVPGTNDKGALVRVISKWDWAGSWHCDGSERPSWDNMTKGWYDDLTNAASPPSGHGSYAWWRDGFYHNGYNVDSVFVDPDLQAWGQDYLADKADEPDALMIGTHGGNGLNGRWSASMLADEFGDDGTLNNCSSWQGHMQFGDSDLEFLHLSSCDSMDQDDWYPNWSSSFAGVHQVDGFHGIMYIDSGYVDEYRDFSDDGFDTGIAIAWVENLYKWRGGADKSQCPVALGVGVGADGQSNCWTRMMYERYNNVYSDPVSPTWYGVAYIEGCNPKNGGALPSTAASSAPPEESKPERLVYPSGASAGAGKETAADELPPLDRTVMRQEGYAAMADAAMPAWTPDILLAPDGPDWFPGVDVARIAQAVGDTTPERSVADHVRIEARDAADTKVIKIDASRSRLRYINRERHFDWDNDLHVAWDPAATVAMATAALDDLGVPTHELGPGLVDTLVGKDYQAGSPSSEPFSSHEIERWATFERTVHGLAVEESIVRAAVSNNGKIARLLVRWPRFRLAKGLVLRPRQEVVDEIGARIFRSEFGAAIELDIHLAYVPSGDDYIPAAVVAFNDPYSGEIVAIPLVETPRDGDQDGVPDADDNCPDDRNPGQEDLDGDGVGDVCDNCPKTPNPGQEDGIPVDPEDPSPENLPNGIGDACEEFDTVCLLADMTCEVLGTGACAAEAGAVPAHEVVNPVVFLGPDDLAWTGIPGATYRVHRGAGNGGVWKTTNFLTADPVLPRAHDPEVPQLLFHYFVELITPCGGSGVGFQSSGVPRDPGVPSP